MLALLLALFLITVQAHGGGGDTSDLVDLEWRYAVPVAVFFCGILAGLFFLLHKRNVNATSSSGH